MKKDKPDFIRKRNRRIRFMGVLFCFCLIFLCGRIGYYIFVWGDTYEKKAVRQLINQQRSNETITNPTRGFIRDRNHQPLAVSSRVYNIALDIKILDTLSTGRNHKAITLNSLHEILEIPMEELETYFAKDIDGNLLEPTNWKIIKRNVPGNLALQVRDLRCVYLENTTQRTYTNAYLASHTIGFIRGDSDWGLENFYKSELTGEAGRVFRTFDQESNPVTEEILPVNGYTLITTLDSEIQRIAQTAVDNAVQETACEFAGIIVMQPYTGEILAMAQWPSFSLNDPSNPEFFTNRRLREHWDVLSDEKKIDELNKMWGNYHVSRTFEPGSIFKPVVVAAALEENVINRHTDSFFCGAEIQVYDRDIPCWYIYGHGGQDVVEVLANSCNVAMVLINERLGRNRFYNYRNDFGFGDRTGIDLPGEEFVSSPAVMYTLSQLNPVEMATNSIGQSFNNTSIQAINAFAAVINGGNVMKPYLVSQIVDEHENIIKENKPTIVRKVISAATSDFMREAMHSVVQPGGTAYRSGNIEGYTIGGKTGSGQQGRGDTQRMTVSYIAYTPVENPEFIIMGVLDNLADPTLLSGSTVVPMVRNAMIEIINYRNMQPTHGEGILTMISPDRDSGVMKDYSGLRLTEVTHLLNNLDIDYQVIGSGAVVQYHLPAAGQPVPNTSALLLYTDTETPHDEVMVTIPLVEGLAMEVGEAFIKDLGLEPVSFIDKPDETNEQFTGGPVTMNPSEAGEENALITPIRGTIYRQFPDAGTVVPQKTEIKLRVRLE